MPPAYLLVHSPSVGPATWAGVAARLRTLGRDAAVPSLLGVATSPPPYWPTVVAAVGDEVTRLDERHGASPLIVVAHSNAGLFVPLIVDSLGRRAAGAVFVDAALPAPRGATPVAPPQLLEALRGKAGADGVLPRWTEWWDEADVAPLFPDDATRARITAEQPRLPITYFAQRVPVPPGWADGIACGYVLFGPPYDAEANAAGGRGMWVERLPGLHLHQVVAPEDLARLLVAGEARLPP